MLAQSVLTKDLVLIGGGHAHALVLRQWGMKPLAGARLTLINPAPTAPYSGMLPGHIAGHYTREALDIDLVKLARFAGARLVIGHATEIDPVAKTVTVEGGREIGYDVASVDIGIHAQMPDIPGFSEHACGAKPLDVYAAKWQDFLRAVAAGDAAPHVVVIGAGVAGVELALAMAHALRDHPNTKVHLIEAGDDITARAKAARAPLRAAMRDLGVALHARALVARITADHVVLADGAMLDSQFIVGTAGAFAHGWLQETALPLTPDGFIPVGQEFQVQGHDDLFAVGDCAEMLHDPRPKAGVFAVRAAPVLAHNLRAALTGGSMKPFKPQNDYLKLISMGGKRALAEKWGRAIALPGLWRWKDHIDQKFMQKFREYPAMSRGPETQEQALGGNDGDTAPLCGGCGSKVAPGSLTQALSKLDQPMPDEVLTGPGDDAAVMRVGGAVQVLTTDHLRAFTDDHGALARIAVNHAMGDIWAMGAQPKTAMLSVIMPRMSAAFQTRTMDEILAQVSAFLAEEQVALIGGHSSMGAEMTIGVSMTGLLPEGTQALTTAGAQPGDHLIMTRPIGSGTLLAGEMQGRADGRDVAQLMQSMAYSQGGEARLLQPHATAMTDVTGFGLAGHLMAICRASGVAAELDLRAVPTYPGAEVLAEAGVRSTIHDANKEAAPVNGADGSKGVLLHDPQTAGGFLAAVPERDVQAALDAFAAEGRQVFVIGQLQAGSPSILCR
ncbi:Selenide, water dikinase [Aliiroseovarius pelagivivens]|uniref:Selenide, water dikinase n=1 Tax=Aliiroseovarius pelagivivens TaxID=1639690 RepID=A0A2R8ALL2_9RHOB|nr:selenide, water dikinase SelD [Aliiroseovarius pelagivivens]SPF76787.1 Selenide, water dikinase [Aliiroseovarius pelagivivens]